MERMGFWVVRTGSRVRNFTVADACWRRSVLAVSWSDWFDGDLREKSERRLDEDLRAWHSDASAGTIGNHRRQLHSFLEEMAIGDIVISPDWRDSRLMVGTITGEYEYLSDSCIGSGGLVFRHIRPIDWQIKIRKNSLSSAEQRSLNTPMTIYRPKHTHTLERLLAERIVDY